MVLGKVQAFLNAARAAATKVSTDDNVAVAYDAVLANGIPQGLIIVAGNMPVRDLIELNELIDKWVFQKQLTAKVAGQNKMAN